MTSQERAPIAVALDTPDIDIAVGWATSVGPRVSTLKVGLELFLRAGADGVERIRAAAPGTALFLDLKLHDIPNTVAGAARAVAGLRPDYLTVHASGGPAMIRAAVDQLPGGQIAAVTLLTSLDETDLAAIGIAGSSGDAVGRLASLAVAAGAQAVVCSPLEVSLVRSAVGTGITLITPGVRPAGADAADQARVSTPEQALADGADIVVIGRPITSAPDLGQAVDELARRLAPVS